jgi:hypothetical protein
MPVGSKVHRVYKALLREGWEKANAARIAQWRTGQALATGKPPKGKKLYKKKKK